MLHTQTRGGRRDRGRGAARDVPGRRRRIAERQRLLDLARARRRAVRQRQLRVLFLVTAHNSLSRRAQVELAERGRRVTVAVVDSAAAMESAVDRHEPELIVCPMLKTIIPESIWARRRCLIVHPGPMGDRGPSSLDWAIELGATEWP